jgi:hypothetical protein
LGLIQQSSPLIVVGALSGQQMLNALEYGFRLP